MILLCLLALLAVANAADHVIVRPGDTVESIALHLGDPELAVEIRRINGLAPEAGVEPGQVLWLPDQRNRTAEDQDALVVSLRGSATVAPAEGGEARPLELAARVPAGSTICTGPGSFATIRLAVQSRSGAHDDVNLLPATCAVVDSTVSLGEARSSLLSVLAGSINVRQADDDGGRVTVRTPSGVTYGEQGGFRVTIEEGAARAEALTGAAAVVGAGVEVSLDPGEGSRVQDGQAPSQPIGLIGAGQPLAPDSGEPLRRPDFKWTEVDQALGYRFQISTAPDFSDVVFQEDLDRTTFSPDVLFLPFRVEGLWWRVSSFDRWGFEGTPSEPRALGIPPGVGP